MTVTSSELKEVMETITDTQIKTSLNSRLAYLVQFTNSTPDYSSAGVLSNISLVKSSPYTGIITFTFPDHGMNITVSYRR